MSSRTLVRSAELALLVAASSACGEDPVGTEEPPYPRCAGLAPGTLLARAEHYDRIALGHMPEGQDLVHAVFFEEDMRTVERLSISDNAGSWSAIYVASQAYRFAVTRDPAALDNVRRGLRGMTTVLEVTGVPGLFARAYVDPILPGFPSSSQLLASYPDCDLTVRHCKRWQQSSVEEYAGLWFKSDVSKDEYTGQVFALGAIFELVDDSQVRGVVRSMLSSVGAHLIDHNLQITDIDGRPTTFGLMSPVSLNDFPGFNALLVLSWFKVIANATRDPRFERFYADCLLRENVEACERPELATSEAFTAYLSGVGLDLGCKTNWNNHHMAQLAMFSLAHLESGPPAQLIRQALRHEMWEAETDRPMREQDNALFTFFYSINRPAGAPRPDAELARAQCILGAFPDVKAHHAVDTTAYPEVCRDRNDEPLTDIVIPFAERDIDNYMWKKNPYAIKSEAAIPNLVESPEDYLLAYWLARHFGILDDRA
ncbi:MAG: hypothetical protein HYV07_10595 [Deltaproteobacteria bacterium]|nr:hypothetical protein [Deltaproteobacteria bacterium]